MSVFLIDYENVNYNGLDGIETLGNDDEVALFYSSKASSIPLELTIRISQSKASFRYLKVKRTGKNYLDFQLSALSGYIVATSSQTEFVVISNDTGFDSVLDFWNNQDFVNRKIRFRRQSKIKAEDNKNIENIKPANESAEKNSNNKTDDLKKGQPANKKTDSSQKTKTEKKKSDSSQKTQKDIKKADSVSKKMTEKKSIGKLPQSVKEEVRKATKDIDLAPSEYLTVYRLLRKSIDKQEYYTSLVREFNDQVKGCKIYKATTRIFLDLRKGE